MLFTPLHRLLGRAAGPITDEMIDAAVTARLAEAEDLDWKGKLIPVKDLRLSDYPKDVAAMANRGGGLLVYGVKESGKKATERVDVGAYDERYDATLVSVAVSAINPPVFNVRAHWVGEPGNQVVAVVIPASSDVPHLIYKDDYFGAPLRNDAMTVWMKERQLAALYRARFDERRHSTEALENLYSEAATNWATPQRAWLIAVAHPQLPSPATERPDREKARELFAEARTHTLAWAGSGGVHPLDSVELLNPRPGLRRWVAANNSLSANRKWREAWAALHHDGSVTVAAAIGGQRVSMGTLDEHEIDSASIETVVSDFMALIRVASSSMSLSEYDVKIGIEWLGEAPLQVQSVDSRGYRFDSATPLVQYSPVFATVSADTSPLDFYWRVHDLAEDCINQGGVADVVMIRPPSRGE